MSESGARAGRRGGRRGRGRGRGMGGGVPNAASHGGYAGGPNGGHYGGHHGGADAYGGYAGGGHVQQDWSRYNEEQSFGVNGGQNWGQNGLGGGHDARGRNWEADYPADGGQGRNKSNGYQGGGGGGGGGHFNSEREEGRARALEELRGVLAEQQQGHQQERRRMHENHRRGSGYTGQDWGNRDRRGNTKWQAEVNNGRGARREGTKDHELQDSGSQENGYHAPPEAEGMNQQGYNQRQHKQDAKRGYQSHENGRRRTRQDEHRGGHHHAKGGEMVADVASSDMRVRISSQLARGVAECLVCLDRVKQVAPTWDCHSCYQVIFNNKILNMITHFPGLPPELYQEVGKVSSGDKRRLEVSWMPGGEQPGAH